jgi:hypothetical protein
MTLRSRFGPERNLMDNNVPISGVFSNTRIFDNNTIDEVKGETP